MPGFLGALRKLALAPSLREVTFSGRGFPGADSPAAPALEAIPQAVVCGFEWGIEARDEWELERRLELVEPVQRGFAYEGAAMAAVVRDVMPGRSGRTRSLLLGSGHPHIFLTYIGVGFALARLPRAVWRKAIPDLTGSPFHPTMSWLAVDGYGFDKAYFHTATWVDKQRRPKPYDWQGAPEYFPRAFDQGVGRALWFINGARPALVVKALTAFDADRHADLWSGVGLAATFAGGADAEDLAWLRAEAGEHWDELALGVIFAIKARHHSDHLPAHSIAALAGLTGLTVEAAIEIADSTETHAAGPAGEPAYEMWRAAIRARLQP